MFVDVCECLQETENCQSEGTNYRRYYFWDFIVRGECVFFPFFLFSSVLILFVRSLFNGNAITWIFRLDSNEHEKPGGKIPSRYAPGCLGNLLCYAKRGTLIVAWFSYFSIFINSTETVWQCAWGDVHVFVCVIETTFIMKCLHQMTKTKAKQQNESKDATDCLATRTHSEYAPMHKYLSHTINYNKAKVLEVVIRFVDAKRPNAVKAKQSNFEMSSFRDEKKNQNCNHKLVGRTIPKIVCVRAHARKWQLNVQSERE